MTQPDILITMDADATAIAQSLSNYLIDHAYTITHNRSSLSWAWIPIVAQTQPSDALEPWFDEIQCKDVIVIPLLLQDVPCPNVFTPRFTVNIADDTDNLQPYFAELKNRLFNGQRLLGKLQKLETHYQELGVQLKNLPNNLNLIRYLNELQHHIDLTRKAILNPQTLHEANQEAILTGIQATLNNPKISRPPDSDDARTVGNPPHSHTYDFKGHETEIATISNYVHNTDIKMISILGQERANKTALACHVLDVLSKHDGMSAILYLSATDRNQEFTLEHLFMMTGEALGDTVCEILNRIWKNDEMALETRIDYLIDQYVENRCLLLFDNLEDSLTLEGQFIDGELTQFLRQFLTREHQSTILMTSRVPVTLHDRYLPITKIVPLSMGLCDKYAIAFLQDLDQDGTLGLRDADPVMLSKIVKQTKGFPRILEAVAGILANRPLMTLDELIDFDLSLDDETLILNWVSRAEAVLDTDQRLVMQALAIFAHPVNKTAIQFLLDPYVEITGIDIPFTLERLQRGHYITLNHTTGDISIHPLDKDYNYNLIKEGDPDVGRMSAGERFFRQMDILPLVSENSGEELFTRLTLEKRAGDYYAQLRGQPSDWKTIYDLQPYFLEYKHRLRAHDYESAFTMLITIYNLLKLSGFSRKIIEMILPLIDYLPESYLMTCYNMLGMAYDDLGHYKKALDCHLTALPLTWLEDNHLAEAAHLSGIGLQYSNLGEYGKALEHYELALEISRETGKRKQERGILNNMAVVYNSIGRKLEGLSYYEESLGIAREIDDQQGIAVTLANIGDSYGAFGNVDKTIDCYQEAIERYTSIGDKFGRGVTLGKLGNVAIMLGNYDDALKLLAVAVDIAHGVGNRMWEVLHKADMAAVHVHQGDIDKGLGLLEQLLPDAKEIGTPIVMNYAHSLLAGMLLYSGQFKRACTASEIAIQYVSLGNRHYEYALYGLIQVRLEKIQEARNAFNMTLDHAAELLENTSNLYSPKYSRGLALMGLALVTNDMTYAEDAKQAYLDARQNCDAKGIVSREMKKLNMLTWGITNDDNLKPLDETQDE